MTDLSHDKIPLTDPEDEGGYFDAWGCIIIMAIIAVAVWALAGFGAWTLLGL